MRVTGAGWNGTLTLLLQAQSRFGHNGLKIMLFLTLESGGVQIPCS